MNYIKLSKEIAYILRHNHNKYDLKLDEQGFVLISDLLNSLNQNSQYENKITNEDLIQMLDTMDKRRFEIVDNKIRALYGHSFINPIQHKLVVHPSVLYMAHLIKH